MLTRLLWWVTRLLMLCALGTCHERPQREPPKFTNALDWLLFLCVLCVLCGEILLRHWQREAEERSAARALANGDGAAVCLHQRPHDGKAQSSAASGRRARGIGAEKALEDALAQLRRHPRPGVRDAQPHRLPRAR